MVKRWTYDKHKKTFELVDYPYPYTESEFKELAWIVFQAEQMIEEIRLAEKEWRERNQE